MSLARRVLWITVGVALAAAVGTACSSDGGAGAADAAVDDANDASAAVDARADVPAPEDLAPGRDEGARTDAEAPADTGGGPVGVPVFRFGTAPDQPLSSAPFPNDLYFEADGSLALAPLEDDPLLKNRAKREVLASWNALVDARTGFGTTSAIWFFTDAAVDPATLTGAVQMITLDGPEQGREIAVQAFWSEGVGVGVFPAWGDYLVPGSRYAVVITRGIRTADGEEVATPPPVRRLLADTAPADPALGGLHGRWGLLRQRLGELGRTLDEVVVATVFTTQEVLPYARRLFDAVDAFVLAPPTRRVSWDVAAGAFVEGEVVEGAAALDDYFGVPAAPFETNPGVWLGARESAAALPDQQGPYTGGSFHARIARVVNGSIEVPVFNFQPRNGALVNTALRLEGGRPQSDLRAIVPFTLYLCDIHADEPTAIPVGIFSHGGGATRVDAIAWANGNCRVGVATIAIDMVFHGGRRVTALREGGVVVPTAPDVENAFSGLSEGDPGYVPDRIGDDETAVASVAPLYAVGVQADPGVIEANLLTIAADTATLLRYVREGDWSQVLPGLSFDPDRVFHQSVSFGTSFHTPLLALEDGFAGLVGSVGSGYMLTVNLLMAPVNAAQAGGVLSAVLGLKTGGAQLMTFSLVEPVLALHQWLQERGDPMPYAPYLLRHRAGTPLPPIVHSADSWDETLYSPAQLSYAVALGLPVYTAGVEWTIDPGIPGAERLAAQPAPVGPLSGNAVFGGGTTTAGIFFRAESCHGMVNTAVCKESFEHPYPPVRLLPHPVPKPSPICALHAQMGVFLTSILDGGPVEIVPPAATCGEVY
jgi:hypothetical protein